MENDSTSAFEGFILVGFSDRPHLELDPFVVVHFFICWLFWQHDHHLTCSCGFRLHTPMYFFCQPLQGYVLHTGSIPQMLYNLQGADKTISYLGCAIQLYFVLALAGCACALAVMAYDRYCAAVCRPLHYMVIMHPRLCGQLASAAWLSGFGNSLIMAPQTLMLPRCGNRRVDHFLCEMPALIAWPVCRYHDPWGTGICLGNLYHPGTTHPHPRLYGYTFVFC